MSRIFSLIILLTIQTPILAQNLSGKWVGYFRNISGIEEKIYPYEINITIGSGQQINAITITQLANQFTATAIAKGIYTPNVHLLSLQETKFEQIHLDGNLQACLMNNFLTYKKDKHTEILQGTYTSKNITNGTDCGMGSVYLERDIISAMAIATKKMNPTNNKNKWTTKKKDTVSSINKTLVSITKTALSTQEVSALVSENNVQHTAINTTQLLTNQASAKTSPQALIINKIVPETTNNFSKLTTNTLIENTKNKLLNSTETISKHEHKFIPWVLIARENLLAKKIITHSKSITIDLIDNGTIDNDTITIYNNNTLMLDHNRLSYKAIHFDLKFDENHKTQEVIVVANNLGSVPPNTALLIYKDAKQTEEISINTNLTQNAKLIIEYQPLN